MRGMYIIEQAFDFIGSHYEVSMLHQKAWSATIVPSRFSSEVDAEQWMLNHWPTFIQESIPYFKNLVNNLATLRPIAR